MEIVFERLTEALTQLPEDYVDSRRVFHGRGKCFTGLEFLSVDLFDPVLLVTLFDDPGEDWLDSFVSRLKAVVEPTRLECVLLQRRDRPRAPTETLYGSLSVDTFARRGPLRFRLTFEGRQNCGYFLDMEPGRKWLEQRCLGKRVLNLFSYTCAFSVVAIAGGAERVVNVDMSSAALNEGRANHRLNELPTERTSYIASNVLKSWGRIKRQGPYDAVIVDPPSFQRGSFQAERDYGKVARRLPELLGPGGEVLACLNAPELKIGFLKSAFETNAPELIFDQRLDPDPTFPDMDPERQLKLLVFRKRL